MHTEIRVRPNPIYGYTQLYIYMYTDRYIDTYRDTDIDT